MPKSKSYKHIHIEDLPKWESGEFSGCIDWNRIDNTPVRFQYNDFHGTFIAKYFDKEKGKILVEYNGTEIWCHRSTFRRSNVCRIIGKIQHDFRYEINDIYTYNQNELKIIDRKRVGNKKYYKVFCCKCGYNSMNTTYRKGKEFDHWIAETNLTAGVGCPTCGGSTTCTQTKINDIATTDKWMVKFFCNKDYALRLSHSSEVWIDVKCPICGKKLAKKVQPNTIYRTKTISCPICSDGKSYPEKFVASMLDQLGIYYVPEYRPKWANGMRYDFFLPCENIIIEVDGGFHIKDNSMTNQKFTEVQRIDKVKEDLAMENEYISVVRIEAYKSDKNYMIDSISKTLKDIFDISFVNWEMCEKAAVGSQVISAVEMYNAGNTIAEISNKLKICERTVRKYLLKGYKNNMCADFRVRKRVKND